MGVIVERRHHMNTLAAGQLGPGVEPFALYQRAKLERRVGHGLPPHALAGIEVDDNEVGLLKLLHNEIPAVQLDHPDRDNLASPQDCRPTAACLGRLRASGYGVGARLPEYPSNAAPCDRTWCRARAAPV